MELGGEPVRVEKNLYPDEPARIVSVRFTNAGICYRIMDRDGPLYLRIAHQIRRLIESKAYRPGDRLPSIRELGRQMHVSLNTVKAAYDLLEGDRIVEPRPQSGYYVARRLPELPTEPAIDFDQLAPIEASTGTILAEMDSDVTREDIIHLGDAIPGPANLPTAALARHLVREVQSHPEESMAFRAPPRESYLREQIAKYLLECGCVVSPNEIVVTTGAQEAIMLALLVACSPGDVVAIESPAYFSFIQQLERLGLQGIEVPTTLGEGISLEALEYVFEHERVAACLLSANFSNPTGSLMPDANKRRLVDLVGRYDIPLIEDDIFGDVYFGRERPRAVRAFDERGNVLLCSSFSWTLCPGCRVGWIVPGRYQSRIEQAKRTMSIATSAPGQMALTSYLSAGAHVRHLRRIRSVYASNMRMVSSAIVRSFPEGTRMTDPQGGLMLWLELPNGVDTIRLYELAHSRGISIAPGPVFSLTGKFTNCLRVSVQHWTPEIEAAIETVGRLCEECTSCN